jgi:hypothetical protein
MEYRLLLDHWSKLVRDFKDREKEHDKEPRESELLAMAIVDYIQWSRIRQWNLFIQQRGEDFDKFRAKILQNFDEDALQRFLEDEQLWKVTLEMAEY